MDRFYCVYMHISPDGLRYIGKTLQIPITRWRRGYDGNKDFYADILRYGGAGQFLFSFQHFILSPAGSWFEWEEGMSRAETNFFTQEEADELEKKWIAHYKTLNPKSVYNRSSGGDHSFQYDEIAKDRNRESHIGLYDGEKNPMYGKPPTAEARKKISESAKLRTGSKNHMTGKHHTDESNEKNRQAHLGLYAGEKNPMYGQTQSPSARAKIAAAKRKAVDQFDITGEVFICRYPSLSDAAAAVGRSVTAISDNCKGRTRYCGQYVFRYARNEDK